MCACRSSVDSFTHLKKNIQKSIVINGLGIILAITQHKSSKRHESSLKLCLHDYIIPNLVLCAKPHDSCCSLLSGMMSPHTVEGWVLADLHNRMTFCHAPLGVSSIRLFSISLVPRPIPWCTVSNKNQTA